MYIVHDFLTSTVTVINPLFLNTSGICGGKEEKGWGWGWGWGGGSWVLGIMSNIIWHRTPVLPVYFIILEDMVLEGRVQLRNILSYKSEKYNKHFQISYTRHLFIT